MLLLFLRMSTTGLTAQAFGAKDPQRLARALVQPLGLALAAGAAIVLLRMPLIDLALHIVGGSEAVLEQARRFLELRWRAGIAGESGPARLAAGRAVRPGAGDPAGGRQRPQHCARSMAGDGPAYERAGAALATVTRIRHFLYWPADGETCWRCAAFLPMLKNAWRGDIRRSLLALNRDIMLRSLLLQLCFGAVTVFWRPPGMISRRQML
jgi:MATE family multidrug resistance protein